MRMKFIHCFTDFGKGFIAGFLFAAIIFIFVAGFLFSRYTLRESVEYAERQIELLELQEDVINRDPVEFFEIPGVRGAADGAAAEFDRKRDEALRAIRQRRIAK